LIQQLDDMRVRQGGDSHRDFRRTSLLAESEEFLGRQSCEGSPTGMQYAPSESNGASGDQSAPKIQIAQLRAMVERLQSEKQERDEAYQKAVSELAHYQEAAAQYQQYAEALLTQVDTLNSDKSP